MALALISRIIIVIHVLLTFSSTLGKVITSVENENVTLGWNIDPPGPADNVLIKHPSNKVIFHIVGATLIDSQNSEYYGRWKFIGNQTSGNIDFVFIDIKQSDAGNYSTQIGIHPNSYGVTLIVYLKPVKPTITIVKEPVVNSMVVVSCYSKSTSVPRGHNSLTMRYVWYIGTSNLMDDGRYHSNGSHLSATNITKDDNGLEIICAAEETTQLPSENSSAYKIVVKYGPGSVILSPFNVSYTLLEITDTLGPIHCISVCNPKCTYQWRRDGTTVTTGAVLLVNNITHEHAGTYDCKATNKHNTRGEISSTVNVHVEYAPVNTKLITSADHNVNETVTFECTTDSVPDSTLQLMYQGDDKEYLNSEKESVKSTFKISRANCLDTGKYFCTATNKIGSSVSDKIDLNVLCSPRHDERANVIRTYVLGNGDSIDIAGTFIANPKPTILWHFHSIMSDESVELQNNTDNVQFFVDFNHVTYTSRALRTNIKAEDFGQYVMIASNDFGKDKLVFLIEHQQTEDPELNYIIESATGGVSVLLVIMVVVIVHRLRKRKKNKKGDGTQVMNNSVKNIEEEDGVDGMKSNVIYQLTGPDNEQQFQADEPIYINTGKINRKRNKGCTETKRTDPGINLIAKEQAARKTARGDVRKHVGCAWEFNMISSEDVYANSKTQKRPRNISYIKNKDDLIYIDIEFNDAGRDKGEVINRRINNRNNYAEIDLTIHTSSPSTSQK